MGFDFISHFVDMREYLEYDKVIRSSSKQFLVTVFGIWHRCIEKIFTARPVFTYKTVLRDKCLA